MRGSLSLTESFICLIGEMLSDTIYKSITIEKWSNNFESVIWLIMIFVSFNTEEPKIPTFSSKKKIHIFTSDCVYPNTSTLVTW